MPFKETKLVLFAADLAGYARTTSNLEALQVAAFLNDWYRKCADAIRPRGGRIVKFIGDACLATFPEEKAVDAVEAAGSLQALLDQVNATHRLKVEVGANVHLAVVAEGEFGPDDDLRYDILGSGVNHLFRMGAGAGVRISEPIYRQLPNDRRGPWSKNKPPAMYTLCE